jgi:hypothetical protein
MCLNVKLDSLSCHLHPYHILVIYHQIFSMNNSKGATSEEGINCFPLEVMSNTTGATSEDGIDCFPLEHMSNTTGATSEDGINCFPLEVMSNTTVVTSEEGINCFPLEHTRNTTGATSEVGTFFPQEHICSLQYCVRFMLLNHSVCYCIVFCRAMFVFSSFLFWSLYCLFFDFWLLITFSGCFKHFLII